MNIARWMRAEWNSPGERAFIIGLGIIVALAVVMRGDDSNPCDGLTEQQAASCLDGQREARLDGRYGG